MMPTYVHLPWEPKRGPPWLEREKHGCIIRGGFPVLSRMKERMKEEKVIVLYRTLKYANRIFISQGL
jgi:hypothetical protein